MSLFKIGILGIIFLILNLILVNLETTALKIRDYGYHHYQLGQQSVLHQQPLPQRRKEHVTKEHTNRRTLLDNKICHSAQDGGYRDIVVFDADLIYRGKTGDVLNRAKDRIQGVVKRNATINSFLSPDVSQKLGLLLVADLVTLLKTNQAQVNEMVGQVNESGIINSLSALQTRLLESDEFRQLKEEFDTQMQNPQFHNAYQSLLNGIMTTLPQTTLYRLINNTVQRETMNLATLGNNVTTNLRREIEATNPSDQLQELYALVTPYIKWNSSGSPANASLVDTSI